MVKSQRSVPGIASILSHAMAFAATALFSHSAAAQSYSSSGYSDPAGSGAIVGAVNWLQGTLLGTVATVVAVIAIAAVGFMMLTGRMNSAPSSCLAPRRSWQVSSLRLE
jgi:type IV secretory pathway VirB2 component (pilin)